MLPSSSYLNKIFELFKTFLKLGCTAFGGPIAHIGYFHNEFVKNKKWLSDSQFSQVLAVCQFLPGPASSQLGFAIGLLRAGWLGAILAFIAFTLPTAILLIIFANNLSIFESDIGQAILHGLKLVAVVVVFDAVLGMSKKLCADKLTKIIAILCASCLLIFPFAWMQLVVIAVAGLIGIIFIQNKNEPSTNEIVKAPSVSVNYSKKTGVVLFSVFSVILIFMMLNPSNNILIQLSSIFYQAGSFVFGGGHVVLPLLQTAVVDTSMVSQADFLAGYGAAQAMPGPMFGFAGYLGAIIDTGQNHLIGAMIALLFMFIPGFLLITAVLPIWKDLNNYPKFTQTITAINAAVVGVLGAALYDPIFTSSVSSSMDFVLVMLGASLLMVIRVSAIYLVLFSVMASVLVSFI